MASSATAVEDVFAGDAGRSCVEANALPWAAHSVAEAGLLPASETKPPTSEPLGVGALVDSLSELRDSASAFAVSMFASVSAGVAGTEGPDSDNSPRLACAVQAALAACADDGCAGSSCARTADADNSAMKVARQVWTSLGQVFVFVVLVMVVNPCDLLHIER